MQINCSDWSFADYDVKFQGKDIADVIRANDETGEVTVLERDYRDNSIVLNAEGKPSEITLVGKVDIIRARQNAVQPIPPSNEYNYDCCGPDGCCLKTDEPTQNKHLYNHSAIKEAIDEYKNLKLPVAKKD